MNYACRDKFVGNSSIASGSSDNGEGRPVL